MWFKVKSLFSPISFREAFVGLGGVVLLLTAILITIGILAISSASSSIGHLSLYAKKQMLWTLAGLIPFTLILFLDYRWLIKHASWIYWIVIGLLILTAILGVSRGGSRRWLKFGPLLLQTSEIMKIAIIIILAKILTTQQKTGRVRDLVIPYSATLLPMVIIAQQPDLGTSLVFIPIVFVMVFAAGASPRHLAAVIFIGANLAIPVYSLCLHDYQKQRLDIFRSQHQMTREQKQGAGYHLTQSKIAHGNGGWLGRGWRKGTQNQYGFLPERHTDFIFAVIGEEWGFVGTTTVLCLYLVLYFTMLLIAYTTPAPSMQLIIIGIATLFTTQTVVNTCMTVGLAPITGLPLPFLSYGGSSLLFNISAIALILSITGRRTVFRGS